MGVQLIDFFLTLMTSEEVHIQVVKVPCDRLIITNEKLCGFEKLTLTMDTFRLRTCSPCKSH